MMLLIVLLLRQMSIVKLLQLSAENRIVLEVQMTRSPRSRRCGLLFRLFALIRRFHNTISRLGRVYIREIVVILFFLILVVVVLLRSIIDVIIVEFGRSRLF